MRTIIIRYGIGYGTHDTEIEVDDDATEDEIEEWVQDAVTERLWFSWKDSASTPVEAA